MQSSSACTRAASWVERAAWSLESRHTADGMTQTNKKQVQREGATGVLLLARSYSSAVEDVSLLPMWPSPSINPPT